jgi:serralysin
MIQGNGADNNLVGTAAADNIYGYGGADTLDGGDGNDNLYAGDGNDTLFGGAGNDLLDGGAGDDTMAGGTGDDRYIVDSAGDNIIENAGEGYDTVLSYISYTLGANLERLDLKGTENLSGWGNELDNTIKGNAGNNYLYGGAGNDSIDGGDGNDVIFGGSGNDFMVGGNGVDTLSYAEATAAVHVSLAITASSQNTGGAGFDKISGFENLTGSDYNDELIGDAGNNKIVGGLGIDHMAGGAGDDIYSVDNVLDTTIELAGEGTDLVLASVDWTLSNNTENLTLFGAAISGTGNALDNVIRGNTNGNILNGKGGHDNLYGLAGADTFVFDAPDASSSDKVHDFAHGVDKIQVDSTAFGLTTGTIDSSYFVSSSTADIAHMSATEAHGQFLFDKYQNLYFDADGTGSGAAVLIASFSGAVVDSTDIIVGP